MVKRILVGLLLFLVAAFLTPAPVEAGGYLDPNTGGLLFQLLAASFAFLSGLILIFARRIRMGIARIRRFIRVRLGRDSDPGTTTGS